MTKHRPPLSLSEALGRIAGLVEGGYVEMAAIVGRARSTVYAWGDPDTDDDIPMGCARKLDLAYQMAGGVGAPILETYAAQLELEAGSQFAEQIALGRHLQDVLRETSEAELALLRASQPGAGEAERLEAAREVKDAVAVLGRSLPLLATGEQHQTGPPAD